MRRESPAFLLIDNYGVGLEVHGKSDGFRLTLMKQRQQEILQDWTLGRGGSDPSVADCRLNGGKCKGITMGRQFLGDSRSELAILFSEAYISGFAGLGARRQRRKAKSLQPLCKQGAINVSAVYQQIEKSSAQISQMAPAIKQFQDSDAAANRNALVERESPRSQIIDNRDLGVDLFRQQNGTYLHPGRGDISFQLQEEPHD